MKRNWMLFSLVVVCFGICGGLLALLNLRDARASYHDAQRNLEAMQAMVDDIEQLRRQASTVQLVGEQTKQELRPWVERASRAGLGQPSNFMASALKPIDKSDYSQEDVALTLQDASLPQMITFLTDSNDSTEYIPTVIDIRSTGNKDAKSAEQERWTVNLVLTRLIYTAINRSGD